MESNLYQAYLEEVESNQVCEDYEEGEMQMISRKIVSFFDRVSKESQKDASRKIGVCIYMYASDNGSSLSRTPFQGKIDNIVKDVTFDLKNIPPILARLIALVIDETEFESV